MRVRCDVDPVGDPLLRDAELIVCPQRVPPIHGSRPTAHVDGNRHRFGDFVPARAVLVRHLVW